MKIMLHYDRMYHYFPEKIKDTVKGPNFKLYLSYAFSSWGDRMWLFAAGLALAQVGNDLRLPAISGLVNDALVFVFGSMIGYWIDLSPRFKAGAVSLTATNFSIAIAAAILASMVQWKSVIVTMPSLYYTLLVAAISFTAFSRLANAATKIVLTKDWAVIIAGGNRDTLAALNAMLLRINLSSMIISPMIAGQIMTSVNMATGCIFIAGWNLVCYSIELYCLHSIYKAVPELSKRIKRSDIDAKTSHLESESDFEAEPLSPDGLYKEPPHLNTITTLRRSISQNSFEPALLEKPTADDDDNVLMEHKEPLMSKTSQALKESAAAWNLYRKQDCFAAGLALGLLYMTVLGWDSITTSYALYQGLSENILSLITAIAAVLGILGSFVYPHMRRAFGLSRSTLWSLSAQIACLALCVVSIWLPGSPFDPVGYFSGSSTANTRFDNATNLLNNVTSGNDTSLDEQSTVTSTATVSIIVFLAGICAARFGLWITDLCICQIFQESVAEEQRGVVNGVQNSINMLMDMLKNILVILLPAMETFGILIIASFAAIVSGLVSMCVYNYQVRGHIFHGKCFPKASDTSKLLAAESIRSTSVTAKGTDTTDKI